MEHSFVIKGDDIAPNNPWHFHLDVEILYCVKAKGTNFIGNYVQPTEDGELLLIGRNLAHTRRRDTQYYLQNPLEAPESIVVKFKEDFLGPDFFQIQQFSHIADLLQRAQRGIKFYGKTRDSVCQILERISGTSGILSLIDIISVLDKLANSDEFIFLNGVDYLSEANNIDSQKVNKVFEYTNEHFREVISLAEVASLVNLTEAAFCRYFKARTRKSYFQYLTEIRIANACRMLLNEDKDVSQVCFSSGFNNPSNFHKHFKKIVNLTPNEYRYKSQERIQIL